MTIRECIGDLFTANSKYYLAHCVNAEYKLGRGIAVEFEKRYDMSKRLQEKWPFAYSLHVGDALKIDNVYNLVTKVYHYNKPTITNLKMSLIDMRNQMEENDETKLAIPRIGCGLDKLDWDIQVKPLIEEVFRNSDVDILVYRLK